MPFNEDYQDVMQTIAETGNAAAQAYAETHQEGSSSKSEIDWGGLVNAFGSVAESYAQSRNPNGRQWNDFNVEAKVDKSTQTTIILVVCILAGALIFYGIKMNKGAK